MKKLKQLPRFKNEDEEIEFWDKHSITDYFDMRYAIVNPFFPNLKPSTETISLRLPIGLLYEIKREANKQDIPYQSLIKMYLAKQVNEEIYRSTQLSKKHSFFRVMEKQKKYKTK